MSGILNITDTLSVLVVFGTVVIILFGLPIPTFWEQAFLIVIAFYFATKGSNQSTALLNKQLDLEKARLEAAKPD